MNIWKKNADDKANFEEMSGFLLTIMLDVASRLLSSLSDNPQPLCVALPHCTADFTISE